jgi:hypothetical protein
MAKGKIILAVLLIVVMGLLGTSPTLAGENKMEFNKSGERMEIEQLTTTYAWAIDNKDLDALMSIFIKGEPGVDKVWPIYDISALQIPGLERVEGTTAIRNFMQYAVLPGEPWSFSSISNVNIAFTGPKTATGGDYYIHEGFIPAEVNGAGNVVRTYSQFVLSTYDLLCNPQTLVRQFREGQHLYDFIDNGKNGWKIHVMKSSPTFSAANEIIGVDQISIAKKPWNPMFDEMAVCP